MLKLVGLGSKDTHTENVNKNETKDLIFEIFSDISKIYETRFQEGIYFKEKNNTIFVSYECIVNSQYARYFYKTIKFIGRNKRKLLLTILDAKQTAIIDNNNEKFINIFNEKTINCINQINNSFKNSVIYTSWIICVSTLIATIINTVELFRR